MRQGWLGWVQRAGLAWLLMAPMAWGHAASHAASGRSVVITDASGTRLRITPYGRIAVRLQAVRAGEDFFADDRYEMVESHDHGGRFDVKATSSTLRLTQPGGLSLSVDLDTLAVSYADGGATLLREQGGVRWEAAEQGGRIVRSFEPDAGEHFTALGHGYFGRADSVDLKGQRLGRNYGRQQLDQAPLIVPFYLSSKGYGVFLNSSAQNFFDFGREGRYELGIDAGRMDYFVIKGPQPADVLRHYIELTGKPRLPPKAMFGLALSDKGHDHDSPTPSDEAWWKQKVQAHRAAGLPLDHLVNDNRWRAGGGRRCESRMAWDRGRYPDPAEYARWLKANGLVMTLDINRCIAQFSKGWQPAFNIPQAPGVDFASSAPDLTNAAFRHWFWHIFFSQSLDPRLAYPGDALWIDEFDEMGAAPDAMPLADGRSFGEMRNYWFFLIAKALVQQGWDRAGLKQRPYVWVRGMTAGAQRYASLWSGDIKPSDEEMKQQVRGMQLAGLSGFPFWGHDAGGFYDWDAKRGPDAGLYERWAMGLGSFAPIWKPHGMGPSRWPLDRTAPEQAAAARFARVRYELMPYTYSAAREAASSGLPMARALLLAYPQEPEAWKRDLQYLWGPDLLVAPNTTPGQDTPVWLPPGLWYDWWRPAQPIISSAGGSVVTSPWTEALPVYVKAGALIVRQTPAPSTAFADAGRLRLDVYTGADGEATLLEDDGMTENYRRGQSLSTRIRYSDGSTRLQISGAQGRYRGAPRQRAWDVTLHGPALGSCYVVNGIRVQAARVGGDAAVRLAVARGAIRKPIVIQACR